MTVSFYLFFLFCLLSCWPTSPNQRSHGDCQSGLGKVENQDSASQSEAGEDPSGNSAGPGEGEEAWDYFERSESSFEKGKVADEESAGESGKGSSGRAAC